MPNLDAARPVAGQPIETAWGQQVHDSIERNTVIAGRAKMLSGVGFITVTYGVPFTTTQTAVVASREYTGQVSPISITCAVVGTTGCTFYVRAADGSIPAVDVDLFYMAFGY